jgi:release factor glutamine methyltransferase
VRSALREAVRQLRTAGVDSPHLVAEVLLGYVLGWDRTRVLSYPETILSPQVAARVALLARRRAAGEPLQYLTGTQEFFGRSFRVSPHVLIPRPETEILVEKVSALAHSLDRDEILFVDVGTGSGCIAVSLAHELPGARGYAVDLSREALEVARENAATHGVLDRVRFVRADLLECFAAAPTFDVIVSNPPYVAQTDAAALSPTVREHEPQLALFGGPSGLEVYRGLVPQAAARLNGGGFVALEIGAGMATDVRALLENQGLTIQDVYDDLQGIPRVVIGRREHG